MNQPDQQTLRIVIVGGVAGGASAAARARRMNERAEIVLLEKDEHVSFANCGLPYYIGQEIVEREDLLVATPEFLAQRFRIDVRVRQEATAIDRERKTISVRRRDRVEKDAGGRAEGGEGDAGGETYELAYDKLILAPGARPVVPPLEGADAENVLTLRNLEDTDRIKAAVDRLGAGRALVVGAGFIGLEMVEQLVRRGVETTLVELQPQVLPLLDPEMAKLLALELERQRITLHVGAGVKRFEAGEKGLVTAAELDNGQRLETDLVILGIGVRPNVELAQSAGLEIGKSGGVATNDFMQTSDPDIYAVGDAAEYPYGPTGARMRIALAGPANRAGRLAGEHAATGRAAPMAPVMGTSIVRVFDKAAAMTGLSRGLARRMGIDARSVTIVSNHHAGYFPGAEPLTLKLVYTPGDGRILGAQCVGAKGVDKRIDVIATAMRFGATAHHLAGLDLAYAPPFGAAKDPVHLAAFVACNELDGVETICQPDEDIEGKQVVDVRTAEEIERAPLKDAARAIAIPVDELRDRIGELDADAPTVVSCAVGVRGHIAARILKQNGFQVANLTGGATLRNLAR